MSSECDSDDGLNIITEDVKEMLSEILFSVVPPDTPSVVSTPTETSFCWDFSSPYYSSSSDEESFVPRVFRFLQEHKDSVSIGNAENLQESAAGCAEPQPSTSTYVKPKALFRNFECTSCSFLTYDKSVLDDHINQKHTKREEAKWYPCPHCPYMARTMAYRKQHIRRHFTPIYSCRHCTYMTESMSELGDHHKLHTNPFRYFVCDFCSYKTRVEHRCAEHLKQEHPEHIGTTRWYECSNCNVEVSTIHDYEDHVDEHHKGYGGSFWYCCTRCGFRSTEVNKICEHDKEKHRPKSGTVTTRIRLSWLCKTCAFVTSWQDEMEKHSAVCLTGEGSEFYFTDN